MPWDTIPKSEPRGGVTPNLGDYAEARASFSWEAARQALDGLPGGGLNIAHEAIDRHVAHGRGDHLALRWLGKSGAPRDFSYAELARQTNRFASALRALGVGKGDRVFGLMGRIPELYIAALGTLKNGSVFSPLFSAFGPEPIRSRMEPGDAKVLVTTEALYRKKVMAWRQELPNLAHVLLTDGNPNALPEGTLSLAKVMETASDSFAIEPTKPEDMALLHFTSGTTGKPKGAVHVHEAVVAHTVTGKLALDIHKEDRVWCTADPGWVTGMSYGIIAPLANGATLIVDEAEFDAERWYQILQNERVTRHIVQRTVSQHHSLVTLTISRLFYAIFK